jgi:hypothetical protein
LLQRSNPFKFITESNHGALVDTSSSSQHGCIQIVNGSCAWVTRTQTLQLWLQPSYDGSNKQVRDTRQHKDLAERQGAPITQRRIHVENTWSPKARTTPKVPRKHTPGLIAKLSEKCFDPDRLRSGMHTLPAKVDRETTGNGGGNVDELGNGAGILAKSGILDNGGWLFDGFLGKPQQRSAANGHRTGTHAKPNKVGPAKSSMMVVQ